MSERVHVVEAPVGPPCCVQTDNGRLIRGYRVSEDYPGTVFHGRCVTWRTLDSKGNVVFDADGRQQVAASANGKSLLVMDEGTRVEILDADPPALLPPVVRR